MYNFPLFPVGSLKMFFLHVDISLQMLSTICEKQNWMQSEEEHSEEHIVTKKSSDKEIKNMKKQFDELFA